MGGVAAGLFTIILGGLALLLPVVKHVPAGFVIGGLLLLAGLAELSVALRRPEGPLRRATLGSGLITAISGLVFAVRPYLGIFPASWVIILWLVLRGLLLLRTALRPRGTCPGQSLLAYTAVADLALGALLILGLRIAAFVVSIFGPTEDLIARFALILAISLAVAGGAQIAIALAERREPGCSPDAAA